MELHLVANESDKPLFTGAIAQSVYRTGLPTPEQQLVSWLNGYLYLPQPRADDMML